MVPASMLSSSDDFGLIFRSHSISRQSSQNNFHSSHVSSRVGFLKSFWPFALDASKNAETTIAAIGQ
jgi:hypothetical protein